MYNRTRSVAFLLGLTGNIACGKSTVGELLADHFGADYIDADRLVHDLYAAGTPETQTCTHPRRAGYLNATAKFMSDFAELRLPIS